MTTTIDRSVPNGDGTATVYGYTAMGVYVHVVCGLDAVANGDVYAMLDLAAATATAKTIALATQRLHDEKGENVGN